MHDSIMAYAASRAATMCVAPLVFLQTNGGFGEYAKYATDNGKPFPAWRADEECPQAGNANDTLMVLPIAPPAYCELPTQDKPENDPDHPPVAVTTDFVDGGTTGGAPEGDVDGGVPTGDAPDLAAP